MNKVTREQFAFTSETSVCHQPTGATFSTYRYKNPKDATSSMIENLGRAGDRLQDGTEFSPAEIRAMAIKLLRERALTAK